MKRPVQVDIPDGDFCSGCIFKVCSDMGYRGCLNPEIGRDVVTLPHNFKKTGNKVLKHPKCKEIYK